MKTPHRKIDRAAVAHSLRELEKLFKKRLQDKNDKGLREQAFGETLLTRQPKREVPR